MLRDLHLYAPLFLVILGFVAVFFAGVAFHKYRKRLRSKSLGLSLMAIGGFMSALLTALIIWLPTPTEYFIMQQSLFYADPGLFRSVSLQSNNAATTSFFKMESLEIDKRPQIAKVVYALHTAKRFSPSRTKAQWSVRLTFNMRKTQLSMDVEYRGGAGSENGTLLYIHNKMGTYRCDGMGSVLSDILGSRPTDKAAYSYMIPSKALF